MITATLKEGLAIFKRAIFRRLVQKFKADGDLHSLIEKDPDYLVFRHALDLAFSNETRYLNEIQRLARRSSEIELARIARLDINSLNRVCHAYSKSAMERVIRDVHVNYLFRIYAPIIKEEGYTTFVKRRGKSTKGSISHLTNDQIQRLFRKEVDNLCLSIDLILKSLEF
jgi:hypothetical protein